MNPFSARNRTDRASEPGRRASRRRSLWLGLILVLIALSPLSLNLKAASPPPPLIGFSPQAGTSVLPANELAPACANPGYTSLSQCIDKQDKDNVVIGEGAKKALCKTNVVADEASYAFGKITIGAGGLLLVPDQTAQTPVSITTTGINVAGTLQIGDPACPIGTTSPADKVTITFTGDKKTCSGGCDGSVKGIEVEKNGSLIMYGLKGAPNPSVSPASPGVSWTYLTAPAGPTTYNSTAGVLSPVPSEGTTTLQLASDVTGPNGWKMGDWIAVATTSFSPFETEFVQLAGNPTVVVAGVSSSVTLMQPLKFYHFGGTAPSTGSTGKCTKNPTLPDSYCDPSTQNFGVDERAEVGLISRNIKLTADTAATGDSRHWGGELRFVMGYKQVALQGVEIEKFGKEQLGSYPIHFHMDGSLPADSGSGGTLVNANSIHHSYNKCIAIHETNNLVIQNNVCARITGNIFYEEIGDETNTTFTGNLGMGAMSNWFDVHETVDSTRDNLISTYYWPGDNLQTVTSFNQFNIRDTDNQFSKEIAEGLPRVRGSCGTFGPQGKIDLNRPFTKDHTFCDPDQGEVYFEPPNGFWILNPSTKLMNNSIAGCQDVGKAYWYVPPKDSSSTAAKFIPIGMQYSGPDPSKFGLFQNNRGHGCYSGVYGEDDGLVTSDQLFGYQDGVHDASHQAVVDEFDGLTLSRIKDRGVWLRPSFFVVKDARVATSRDGVSTVTSGGVDGNYPGVWGMLLDSVVVGISMNNVDRWGPCGSKVLVPGFPQSRGGDMGCIDQTVPKNGTSKTGGEFTDRGYPTPDWPMFGFMIYDGPPLIITDRFVNFRAAPGSTATTGFTAAKLLTTADNCILTGCPNQTPAVMPWGFYGIPGCPTNPLGYSIYEGDAALGWFNVNQSSYPAATTTDNLTFTNVDLRHQIYTAQVNRGGFTDGDENTTIVDLDGSLSGIVALDPDGNPLPTISLNNLGINASSNSVDECLAAGAEDSLLEGRPTSGMVPSALGQLEFEQLYPPSPQPIENNPLNALAHKELLTFAKNTIDFNLLTNVDHHQSMPLTSRNGLGDWEPKVTDGYGYTVTAGSFAYPSSPSCKVAPPDKAPGISKIVDLTLTDIVNAESITTKNPFYVQLGICYTDKDGNHPDPSAVNGPLFSISKGYRSYGGGNVVPNDDLNEYWGGPLACDGLDNSLAVQNGDKPEDTKTMPSQCPSASSTGSPVFTGFNPVQNYADMTMSTPGMPSTPNGPPILNNYYYDKANGWLFVWVAQTEPNAQGPSPLGNCTGNKATDPIYCPSQTTGESYYVCPAEGCPSYRIVLNDPNYKPGMSSCGDPYSAQEGYEWPAGPMNQNTLALVNTTTPLVQAQMQGKQVGTNFPFPHYTADPPLTCPLTTP
ncbi:G8 domain-containing protein [Candidatus Binatus sp.]|uniref:G8 domain-containing protein n=1 Tax=Candidatus Binatus sp. TaxID=2811406 RepID=UPI003CC64087